MSGPGPDEDTTRPDGVSAVRSPDSGNGGFWDDEQGADATIPDETPASAGTASAPDYGDEVDTEAGYGNRAGTATGPQGLTGAGLAATEAATAESATARDTAHVSCVHGPAHRADAVTRCRALADAGRTE